MDAPESPWGTSPYQEAVATGTRSRTIRWIIWGAGAAVLFGGVAAWYFLVYAAPHALPLSLTMSADPLAPGSTSPVTVRVSNPSQETAYDVEVAVTLPDKTTAASLPNETPSSSVAVPAYALGDIAPGGSGEVTLSLGTELDPDTVAQLPVTASYDTAKDRTKRFATSTTQELIVAKPALTLAIEAPKGVTRGDPFTAAIRYRNNLPQALAGAKLVIELSRGVSLVSSEPALSAGSLALPTIAPGASGTVMLTLKADAAASASFAIHATVAASGKTVAERVAQVTIPADALAANVTVNGEETASVALGATLTYRIEITNVASIPLKDVAVKAQLGGSLFDLTTVQANGGVLSPTAPTVNWNGVGIPQLRTLEPGDVVALQLSVRLKKSAAGVSGVTAPVTVTATSPTVPPGTTGPGVVASATATGRLAAAVSFDASAYRTDPLGQIANAGPMPPKVGKTTAFAIRWSISTASADLKDAVVTASLPPGVTFTGKLGGVSASAIAYDPRTGQVTWSPGSVKANTTARAAFQVSITPAQNQVGDTPGLIGESRLTATDAFTGDAVSQETGAITTTLEGTAGASGGGTVVP